MPYNKEGWIRAGEYIMYMRDGDAKRILHLIPDGRVIPVEAYDTSASIRPCKVCPASLSTGRYRMHDDKDLIHDFATGRVHPWED